MTRKSLSRSAGGYALTALCLTLLIMTGLSCFAGPAASRTPDIYIAGFFRDGETEKPCYWVNGERKVLSLPVSVYDFGVRDIAAGEGIICVAGYYRIFPDDIAPTACYWEDGVRTDLPAPIRSIEIETITAADGKVYAAGWYEYGDTYTACYWVDGEHKTLSLPDSAAISRADARDIAVVNGKIYIAGEYYDGKTSIACYWEDGVRTDLPAPIRSIEIETITAADGKVYAAGEYFHDNTRKRKVCYWIDGIRTDLSESQKDELYIDYTMVLH